MSQRNDSDPPRRGHRQAPRPLWQRLPEFYQERHGDLDGLLEVLERRLEEYRHRVSAAETRWAGLGSRSGPGSISGPGSRTDPGARRAAVEARDCGTWAALRRTVEARLGPAACCVPALSVVVPGEGPRGGRPSDARRWEGRRLEVRRLEVRRASAPSVLLLWTQRVLSEAPAGFEIPGDLLPPGVQVQAALVGRAPVGRAPLPGERLQGVVFWERVPATARFGSLEDER